ncbi:MAG: molybdopterin biosynthesis protein [Halobacteriota archaeon]
MDERKEFRTLISVERAHLIIRGFNVQRAVERVPLRLALGRMLAQDVVSTIDVPAFDRAAMDGFAVTAQDTYAAREDEPIHLRCRGAISAGTPSDQTLSPGEAMEVATGAMMPTGADAEVMVEHVEIRGRSIEVRRPASVHENVISAGSDVMAGELVLRKGVVLTEREIGALATIGCAKVAVLKPLSVGVISTGNEITAPGNTLLPGQVYDVNTYSIGAAVKASGAEPVYYGILPDDLARIEATIDRATSECDVIISSGSTSAGRGDVVYRIAEQGTLLAHGINIKPGKPFIIAELRGKPFFGLPGYPVSALMTYYVFVDPFIRGTTRSARTLRAKLAIDIHSEARFQLLPVNLVRGRVYPVEKSSDAMTTLLSDGFIQIPENVRILDEGETVEMTLFGEAEPTDLMFIGSHDIGVDVLLRIISASTPHTKVINVGSQGGLTAVRKGIADIAGIHLLSESGEYNMPFVRMYGLHHVTLVKGYLREQGLITRKGGRISLDDLAGKRFINRNRGSGTRILTDLELEKIAVKRGVPFSELTQSIKGYTTEARTHSAVAAAIRLGKADIGIGIRSVAELNGLDFQRIADEQYDFLIPSDRLVEAPINAFLRALQSDAFAEALPMGLHIYERTGEQITVD